MIFGIGTDIVDVTRMQSNLEKFGERFAKRILHEEEFAEFLTARHPANFLAKRFAAKEAFAKAIGTGFRNGLSMRHICVTHNPLGKPLLELCENARELMLENAIVESHISITDEKNMALAFVILISHRE